VKASRRPRPTRPFTVPRPAGRPAPARRPAGYRRAVVAIAAVAFGPVSMLWLIAHGRLAQAGILTLLLLGYAAAEVVAFARRHPPAYLDHGDLDRAAGARLAGHTPQTVDWETQWWEAGRP